MSIVFLNADVTKDSNCVSAKSTILPVTDDRSLPIKDIEETGTSQETTNERTKDSPDPYVILQVIGSKGIVLVFSHCTTATM